MDPWVLWLVAAIAAAAGPGAVLTWVAFLLVSAVLLAALRPLARSHRRLPAQLRTGTAALVGRTAMVTERIANREGSGSVKLEGESWTARAYDEDEVIEPGSRVHVVEIRGATALV